MTVNDRIGCCQHRSPVPDLLFEDIQAARVADIRPYLDQPEAIDEQTPLHRLTVFLTYACNLACPYCKTIVRSAEELRAFPQKQITYSQDRFRALLSSLEPGLIHHLHFTGGEATLVADLPNLVREAKARGVQKVSLTSNGTRPLSVYRALIESGLDEIRISIDARTPEVGLALTQREGAWQASVAAIQGVAALRDAGAAVFLIANTVVGMRNRHDLAEIVRFLLSLGPNDIKLITEVQEKHALGDFPAAESVKNEITKMLDDYPPSAFPLLRRKIATVFTPETIGLGGVVGPEQTNWRCYIPLTERTVDGQSYYPCSVYLRERGKPLGAITDSPAEQRAKTAAFVREHDCLADPICQQYCLHCTREFNIAANQARET